MPALLRGHDDGHAEGLDTGQACPVAFTCAMAADFMVHFAGSLQFAMPHIAAEDAAVEVAACARCVRDFTALWIGDASA